MSDLHNVRRLLQALEPIAAAHWFAPEWREDMAAAGLEEYAAAYFGARAAPLGPVPHQVVGALFYNWNPALVKMAVRWDLCSPDDAWAASWRGVRRVFDRVFAGVDPGDIERAASLLREPAASCPPEGRAMYAAYSAMPQPDGAAESLWLSASALREFRGDTHIAVLLSHGIGPIEAIVLNAAWIGVDLPRYASTRMWSEDDLQRAADALRARAFLDAEGHITDGGGKFREMVELDTDRRSNAPVEALGDAAESVLAAIEPLAAIVLQTPKAVPRIIGKIGRAAAAG